MNALSNTASAILGAPSGAPVSPLLFGTNIEHTRSCVYKGLSAQLLRNRKFAGKPTFLSGQAHEWYAIGEEALLLFDEPYTRHYELYHMQRANERNSQRIVNAVPDRTVGIGQHELSLKSGKKYEFRIVAKTDEALTLTVSLTSRFGGELYGEKEIPIDGDGWRTYETILDCGADDEDADIRLSFTARASLCIGAVSLLPEGHFRGMRPDVVEALRQLGVKLIRWPGGNFAGEYNWLDGLLPADMRAPLKSCLDIETQPLNMGFDFHEIDTDDFIALCREVGAEPFITINPCWNTPEENAAWVEYCNGDPSTPYGRLRAERGHREPYDVKLWSLGNEFGYGHMEGENSPEGYLKIARANAEKMLAVCPDIRLCSSGPYPNEDWAKRCAAPLGDVSKLVSQHFYATTPRYPSVSEFEKEYTACVSCVDVLKDQLERSRAALPRDTAISMDEWNVWYAWNRRGNVTDAIFAALTLTMLLNRRDSLNIAQACHFEAINEGLIEVRPYEARLTAQGRIFSLMSGHIGGRSCFKSDEIFASEKDGVVFLTAVNPSCGETRLLRLAGAGKLLRGELYTSDAVIPPSDFRIEEAKTAREEGTLLCALPPHSVLALRLERPSTP